MNDKKMRSGSFGFSRMEELPNGQFVISNRHKVLILSDKKIYKPSECLGGPPYWSVESWSEAGFNPDHAELRCNGEAISMTKSDMEALHAILESILYA